MPDKITANTVEFRQDFILSSPPASVLNQYKITGKARVVDGPRPAPGDSIDFSSLLTNSEVQRAFMTIAFGGGEVEGAVFGITPTQEPGYTGDTLVKTPAHIDIMEFGFSRKIPPTVLAMQRDVERQIARQTGVTFHHAKKHRPSKFRFAMFYPEDREHARAIALEFHDLANNAPDETAKNWRNLAKILDTFSDSEINCSAFPTFNEQLEPLAVLVIIKTGKGYDPSCVYEEMVQSMGLYRDDDSLVSTLFTDSYKYYERPTELDWLLLKVLYDKRLKNGMTRDQARPIVARILTELRPYADQPPAAN